MWQPNIFAYNRLIMKLGKKLTLSDVQLGDIVAYDANVFEDATQFATHEPELMVLRTLDDLGLAEEGVLHDILCDAELLSKFGFEGDEDRTVWRKISRFPYEGEYERGMDIVIDLQYPRSSRVHNNFLVKHAGYKPSLHCKKYDGAVESVRHLQHIMREVGLSNESSFKKK